MYYKILVNDVELGVFGHEEIQNINLAVGGGPEDMYFFASAVCEDDGKLIHYDWLQCDLSERDVVQIQPTTETNVPEPRRKFVMGRAKRAPSPERSCDFCQRRETAELRIVYIDEHRPSICSRCIELCNEILRSLAEPSGDGSGPPKALEPN